MGTPSERDLFLYVIVRNFPLKNGMFHWQQETFSRKYKISSENVIQKYSICPLK